MPVSQANPAADEKYAAIAKQYDDRYAGPFWELYHHVTREVASDILPPSGHVLDAGAGTGRFSLWLLDRGHRVTLLDPSDEMLEVARRKIASHSRAAAADYVVGSIEKMDFPDAHFDAVFCEGDPLSYCLRTHADAARELVRVLKPGAGFYVSCDNRWYAALSMAASGDPARGLEAAERGDSFDPYGVPVHAFDPTELKTLFERAGAQDVRVTGKVGLMHFLPPDRVGQLLTADDQRKRWYDVELGWARDPARAGLSSHLHVVGRKP